MAARIPIDMQAVRRMQAEGLTCRQIADRLGVRYATLRHRTRRVGISFPLKGASHRPTDFCLRGHDLREPAALDDNGRCVECRRLRDREYKRTNKARKPAPKPKPKVPTGPDALKAQRLEQERTRAILWLDELRERAPTWWERDAIKARIEALRAGLAACASHDPTHHLTVVHAARSGRKSSGRRSTCGTP